MRCCAARLRCPRPTRCRSALPRWPTAPLGADGVLRYELEQRAADVEILPGLRTRALTYGGALPGPTLVSRTGRRPRSPSATRRPSRPSPTCTAATRPPRATATRPTCSLPAGRHRGAGPPRYGADPAARVASGSRVARLPDAAAGRDPLVPRPRHGGDRPERVAGAVRAAPRPRRRGGGARPAVRATATCRWSSATGRSRRTARCSTRRSPSTTADGHGAGRVPGRRARRRDPGQRRAVAGRRGPGVRHRLRLLNASNARAYRLALWPPPARRRWPGPGRQRRRSARDTGGPRRDRPVPG